MTDKLFSIIIPVFNSAEIVGKTVEETLDAFQSFGRRCEIMLINDGSRDQSWPVIKSLAERHNNVTAINLLKNYGQHTAVFCGIRRASGDYLITMDDDLQNPPSEIIKLIEKIEEGHDLVFARFIAKKHSLFRRIGSRVIDHLNYKIFNKPKDIILTNFRIFTREVADRVGAYRTSYPYIPGLLLLSSSNIGNVYTSHCERAVGQSNYSLVRIAMLVARLLFNYSSYPLKFLTSIGFVISFLSMTVGLFYIAKALFIGSQVLGWTTLVVLLSFFNGFTIIMLGVLGEYVSRIVNQLSIQDSYYIKEIATVRTDKQ